MEAMVGPQSFPESDNSSKREAIVLMPLSVSSVILRFCGWRSCGWCSWVDAGLFLSIVMTAASYLHPVLQFLPMCTAFPHFTHWSFFIGLSFSLSGTCTTLVFDSVVDSAFDSISYAAFDSVSNCAFALDLFLALASRFVPRCNALAFQSAYVVIGWIESATSSVFCNAAFNPGLRNAGRV